jgi:uncharacterized iron-regulated protein
MQRRFMPARLTGLFCLLLAQIAIVHATPVTWESPRFQSHPLVGTIYDTLTEQTLTETQLLERLKQHPIVLMGEKHDNPDHHQLEQRIAAAYLTTPTDQMVMEMIAYPTYLGTKISNDSTTLFDEDQALKSLLNWDAQGWPWGDYQAVIRAVSGQSIIRGGNVDKTELKAMYQGGVPNTHRFASMSDIPDSVKTRITDQIFISHCEMMPKEHLGPFVEMQLAKDASMASTLKEGAKLGAERQLLIAGSFHTDKEVGVPLHLKAKGLESVTLTLIEVEEDKPKISDYLKTSGSDFLWFTPATEEVDYCAKMRSHQSSKSN